METGAKEELKDVQKEQTDESQNTENFEQEEGKSIPYDRFKQVIDQKNEFKTKYSEIEKKMQELAWVDDLNKVLAENPEKEKQIIEILMGNDKKAQEDEEDLDEVTLLKRELAEIKGELTKNTESQQKKIYAAYEDDFQNNVKELTDKDSLLNVMLKMATQTVLDSKYKGWRERHIPNVVNKAYQDVQAELDKLFNNKKKDYIDNKTKSDDPDIGKGSLGSSIDKIPHDDPGKMREFVENFYKNH